MHFMIGCKVCLVAVGGEQVWAGSLDTNIYVININTHVCHQVLTHHSAMVTDIIYLTNEQYVLHTHIICIYTVLLT